MYRIMNIQRCIDRGREREGEKHDVPYTDTYVCTYIHIHRKSCDDTAMAAMAAVMSAYDGDVLLGGAWRPRLEAARAARAARGGHACGVYSAKKKRARACACAPAIRIA